MIQPIVIRSDWIFIPNDALLQRTPAPALLAFLLVACSLALAIYGWTGQGAATGGRRVRTRPGPALRSGWLVLWLRAVRSGRLRRSLPGGFALIAGLWRSLGSAQVALSESLPLVEPPLRAVLREALAQATAEKSLEAALRAAALRHGGDFYLLQLAHLTAEGTKGLEGLEHLGARLRDLEAPNGGMASFVLLPAAGLLVFGTAVMQGAGRVGWQFEMATGWAALWDWVTPRASLSPNLTWLLPPAALSLLAAAAGLAAYGELLRLRPFSPRQWMLRRAFLRDRPPGRPLPWHQARLQQGVADLLTHAWLRCRAGTPPWNACAGAGPALPEPVRSAADALAADLARMETALALTRFTERIGLPQGALLVQRVAQGRAAGVSLADLLGAEAARADAPLRRRVAAQRRQAQAAATAGQLLLLAAAVLALLARSG